MRRDLAIDALRGLAIWSMISLHFADGTHAAKPTHAFPYVDGMSAFVLLSGLVLGIVHRRWIDRHSLRFSLDRLTRRVVTLYVCQAVIALAAVAASTAMTDRQFRRVAVLPPGPDLGAKLEWAVTLRFLPGGGNILLMYLLFMAASLLVIPLMARGWWPAVLTVSIALYAASQLWTAGWMEADSYPDGPANQNWLAWQVLFFVALVIGWHWSTLRVPERVDAALPVLIAVSLAIAYVIRDVVRSTPVRSHAADLVDKVDLGPIRVILAFLAITTLYGLFRLVLRLTRRDVLRPLVQTGARSLDSYVLQALALLAIPVLVVQRPWSAGLSMGIAAAVFAACWAWAEIRGRFGIDRLHRLPARAAGAVRTRAEAR